MFVEEVFSAGMPQLSTHVCAQGTRLGAASGTYNGLAFSSAQYLSYRTGLLFPLNNILRQPTQRIRLLIKPLQFRHRFLIGTLRHRFSTI